MDGVRGSSHDSIVSGQSVVAVIRLMEGKQDAKELRPLVLDRTLTNNNRNGRRAVLLLGLTLIKWVKGGAHGWRNSHAETTPLLQENMLLVTGLGWHPNQC